MKVYSHNSFSSFIIIFSLYWLVKPRNLIWVSNTNWKFYVILFTTVRIVDKKCVETLSHVWPNTYWQWPLHKRLLRRFFTLSLLGLFYIVFLICIQWVFDEEWKSKLLPKVFYGRHYIHIWFCLLAIYINNCIRHWFSYLFHK